MKVFYDVRQNVEGNQSFSPSAKKPKLVVESWQSLVPMEILPVTPVTAEELKLIHLDTYVEGVLDCSRKNGFGNSSKEVSDSLLWTNGS